ncbi:hypothetical protein B296_00000827 [Ensete ventricosum]|uniref:TOD1/MUCI70 glycosyltransferase-like domain-containing protein n=1 Tax=Ensete ventricosum TaxID=4639 RepID=A0A427ATR3_ENSVE|nr:hypothetical protein B296_00000827 [Ensete ventricosum]
MTGGSLGLRSGSYGSLQQQLQSGAALPTQSPPLPARKTSKMSLSGSREKERILPRIFKFAGRRKVGMLLLLIASAAVLSFISAVTKGLAFLLFFLIYKLSHALHVIISLVAISDEDTSVSPESRMGFTDHVRNFVNPSRPSFNNFKPPFALAKVTEVNSTSYSNHESANTHNKTQLSIPILPPRPHPCESFTLPPPPADKKRTGPRRKFVKGKKPGQGTGFDINDTDLLEMEECHDVVIASAIFGINLAA